MALGLVGASTEGSTHMSTELVHNMVDHFTSISGFPRWTYHDAHNPMAQVMLPRSTVPLDTMCLHIPFDCVSPSVYTECHVMFQSSSLIIDDGFWLIWPC